MAVVLQYQSYKIYLHERVEMDTRGISDNVPGDLNDLNYPLLQSNVAFLVGHTVERQHNVAKGTILDTPCLSRIKRKYRIMDLHSYLNRLSDLFLGSMLIFFMIFHKHWLSRQISSAFSPCSFRTIGTICCGLYGPCMIVPHKWTKICWLATAN